VKEEAYERKTLREKKECEKNLVKKKNNKKAKS